MSVQFPAALVWPDNTFRVFYQEQAFAGSDGTQHPALAWSAWTAEDWATLCPDVRRLPVVDEPPSITAEQRLVRHPEEAWTLGADAVTVRYDVVDLSPAELAAQLDTARNAKVASINAERDRRLVLGAPYLGKMIDVSDKGRADLGGMSIAALLAQAGTVPWSDGYSAGWITQDNSRLPLPTPADGLALAAAVGDWYGRTMQHARTLKDAALVSTEPAVINHTAGWPG